MIFTFFLIFKLCEISFLTINLANEFFLIFLPILVDNRLITLKNANFEGVYRTIIRQTLFINGNFIRFFYS